MKIFFATQNQGKIKEVNQILKGLPFKIIGAKAAGIHQEIKEDKNTFWENALKKAKFINQTTKQWSIAEDSGLCIKALHGRHGIKTARWAGPNVSSKQLVAYTLKKLKNIPSGKRQAYFVCTIALVSPKGKFWLFTGKVKGRIALVPKSTNRPKLPYDLIFIPAGYKKTFAQMTDKRKNRLSHRAQAFNKLKKFIINDLKEYENHQPGL